MMRNSIVLVDGDSASNRLIAEFLGSYGYSVYIETNGFHAVSRIMREQPRLVIQDLVLPEVDGFAVCRAIRAKYLGPIIIVTAFCNDIDEVAGLEAGADGYLGKPVTPQVLLAHIRAQLRRHWDGALLANGELRVDTPLTLTSSFSTSAFSVPKPLKINERARSVLVRGQDVKLTDAEFDLLQLLSTNAGRVMSRDNIVGELRGIEHDGIDRTIDLRISRLRKKLGDNPKNPRLIKSVRGVGYMLADY